MEDNTIYFSMGMFDSLKVKMDLPVSGEALNFDIDWKNEVFQTKDLDNCLDYYEIGEDRQLRQLESRRGWVKDDEVESGADDTPAGDDWINCNYHGIIRFYTGYCDNPDFRWDYSKDGDQMTWAEVVAVEGWDWWVEFQGTVDDGKVRDIKMLPLEKTAIRVRLASSKEWAARRDMENRTIGAKITRLARRIPGWRTGLRAVIKAESALHNRLSRALYKLS